MYSAKWSPTLRQGDVLGPLPIPLVGNKQEVVYETSDPLTRPEGSAAKWTYRAPLKHVIVASHDCEFNEGKRDRLLLARLHTVNPKTEPAKLEALRLSNDVEAQNAAGRKVDQVDSFVLDPLAGEFENHQFAVFSTLTAFSMELDLSLHDKKKAELEHTQRLLFRRKLAWYFLRTPEDVPEDAKRNPADVMAEVQAQIEAGN